MTAAEIASEVSTNYCKVSSAARALGVDSGAVYRLLQRHELEGLLIDGSQFVCRSSLEKRKNASQ